MRVAAVPFGVAAQFGPFGEVVAACVVVACGLVLDKGAALVVVKEYFAQT